MAFPTVQTRSTGATSTVDTTSHAITMPSGITAGDLLIVVFSVDQIPTCSVSSGGWTKLGQASNSTIVTQAIFYKTAVGGDTCTVTTSTSEQSSHVAFRISGAVYLTGTSANGSSTNSNPPNRDNFWNGAQDYLWIATRGGDSTVVATVAPASFSNLQTQAAAGTSGASTNTAERALNASALDPGTFTSATEQWVSWTLAVSPIANNDVDTYTDNFDDNSISSQWSNWGTPQTAETSQQLTITIPISTANYYGMDLDRRANVIGRTTSVRYASISHPSAAALEAEFQVLSENNGDRWFFLIGNGNINAIYRIDGAQTNLASVAYNATNHQYVRIRESSGTVFWEVASVAQFNANNWQSFASGAVGNENLRVVYEDIDAGCFSAEANQITVTFDDFNIAAAATTTSTSSSISTSSTSSSISTSSTSSSISTSSTSSSISTSSTSSSISTSSTSSSTSVSTSSTSSSTSVSTSSTSSSISTSSTSSSISTSSTSKSTSTSSTSSSVSTSSTSQSTSTSSTSSSISTSSTSSSTSVSTSSTSTSTSFSTSSTSSSISTSSTSSSISTSSTSSSVSTSSTSSSVSTSSTSTSKSTSTSSTSSSISTSSTSSSISTSSTSSSISTSSTSTSQSTSTSSTSSSISTSTTQSFTTSTSSTSSSISTSTSSTSTSRSTSTSSTSSSISVSTSTSTTVSLTTSTSSTSASTSSTSTSSTSTSTTLPPTATDFTLRMQIYPYPLRMRL